MIEKEFQKIAKEEKTNYTLTDYKSIGFGSGTRHSNCIYNMEILYKKNTIRIKNKFGRVNIARIECSFLSVQRVPNFEIYTKNHFWRLFNKKAHIIKIKCEDKNFKDFLQNKFLILKLEKIARETLFQPEICLEKKENVITVVTTYHLAFDDKEKVIRPLIDLYKAIIDHSYK